MTIGRVGSSAYCVPSVTASWAPVRLSRVLVGIKDGTHGTYARVNSGGHPLLSAKNVQDGYLRLGDAESLITESDHREIVANGYPRPGDLLLTIVGTIGRVAVFNEAEPIAFQRSVCFLRFNSRQSPEFMSYMVRSKYFQDQLIDRSKSAAQAGVYLGDVTACSVYSPPLEVQHQIADYLDAETAKIDTLIGKQERLIDTLAERRQAVISHAVAKGLDRSVPMRNSGVRWLGEVPATWAVERIKRLGRTQIGLTYDPVDIVEPEDGVLVLRSGNVQDGHINLNDTVYVRGMVPSALITCAGDILICARNGSRRLIGKNARIPADVAGSTFGAFMTVLRSEMNDYISWVLSSSIFHHQMGSFVTATINQLTNATLNNFEVAVPPEPERAEIVQFLDSETSKIDALSAKAGEMIEMLKERRQSLISAAVTGNIDVRGLA